MKFTDEQRNAVEKRGRIIVSAAAGSGKTAVMIERLVSLILSGTDVKRVLALTFTNKAAAQMRERLRAALSEKIASSEGAERERLKSQLVDLPLAEIGTIHSFCGKLVRANFFLTDTDAAFRVISPDDAEGRTLKARAMDAVFEEAYAAGDSDLIGLLSVFFRKKKDAALKGLVSFVHASARGMENYGEILSCESSAFDESCAYLAQGYERTARLLLSRLEEYGAVYEGTRAALVAQDVARACGALLGKSLFEMAETAVQPVKIGVMPRMTKATGEERAALRLLSGAGKTIKSVYAELKEYADEETERERAEEARARAAALGRLALRFDGEYSALKREANVLDYDDLEHYALKVLSDGEARAALKARYTHIFVDEYQDVNRVQEKILSLLAGDEVFLVGDSKQAIYGFRGSSSAFFEEKRREYGKAGGDLPLTRNFRSAPAVLDAVNRVFCRLAAYEPMTGREGGEDGEVRFHLVSKEKSEREPPKIYSVAEHAGAEQRDPLAERIANIVEEEIAREIYDADEGRRRKVRFSDIAVLVRKNSGEMDRVVRELNRRDIPVSASARVNLCDFFEARVLVDWLSYLDNAEQDVPMASAMLSAAGGFTENDLAAVRLRFPSVYTFRGACRAYAAKMADGLARKLNAFYALAESLRVRAQALSAAEILNELLNLGIETQIAAMKSGALRLARVRRLVKESENMSAHAFLARLKAMGGRLDYAGGGGEEAVQALTMHASKGLEFPIVILADLDVPFHGAERGEVVFTERFGAAVCSYDLTKGEVYETVVRRASKKLQEDEELAGERNLLYVAMTRAKCRLHMLFEGKEPSVDPAYAGRLSDFVDLNAFSDCFAAEKECSAPIARRALAVGGPSPLASSVLAVYRRPYPFAESCVLPQKSSATELMQRERRETVIERGDKARSVDEGLAYHAFLEHVRFGADAEEELARMEREKILNAEQTALLDRDKLRKILALPALVRAAGKKLYREQTFLASIPARELLPVHTDDEMLVQGAIDLLVEEEDGYTVVDYKFSSHGAEQIARDYALQINLYRKAVARAAGVEEKKVRAVILNIFSLQEIPM